MKVVVIVGPPGTGKTRTLVDIAEKETTRADAILYLSYTKAAAEEATSRVKSPKIKPSTLHSFAFNALGMNRAAVVDVRKLTEFAKATGIPFKGSERGSDEPQEGDEYATVLEFAHNAIIDPMEAWERFGRPGTRVRYENFVKSYTEWKKTFGYMDFDDMLQKFIDAPFTTRAAPVVIGDESQDFTPLQWLAFIRICDHAKRVYLAGDDDQAIYEWSGANPHGMADFCEEHGGEMRILKQSYRVPKWPHEISQTLIRQCDRRIEKEFAPRDDQGLFMRHGDFWDIDIAKYVKKGAMILCRDRFKVEEVKKELNRLMIPYDVRGGYSPWTNQTAAALRRGEEVEIPAHWRDFYRQADLKLPVTIQLSTVHQAKGREHHTVIVDLTCPSRVLHNYNLNPDAERRVWYVALTRTSGQLHICGENPCL